MQFIISYYRAKADCGDNEMMEYKRSDIGYVFFLVTISLSVSFNKVTAQSPEINWHTIDGGGGTLSGGNITINSTIGQSDAGVLSGGQYHLEGGF